MAKMPQQEIKVVGSNDGDDFQKKVNKLLDEDYVVSSTYCGFVQSAEYDFCGSYDAILVRYKKPDAPAIEDVITEIFEDVPDEEWDKELPIFPASNGGMVSLSGNRKFIPPLPAKQRNKPDYFGRVKKKIPGPEDSKIDV